jgi:hypothetical protein
MEDRIKPLDLSNQEAIAIDSLTLKEFHYICFWNPSLPQYLYCSTSATVNLNAIITCVSGDRLEDSVEIALLPDTKVYLGDWRTPEKKTGEVMDSGWTRYDNFILAVWWSVLTGQLPVLPPVIYLTALSGYTYSPRASNPGSVKQIIFSAASGPSPILRIMVCLTILG